MTEGLYHWVAQLTGLRQKQTPGAIPIFRRFGGYWIFALRGQRRADVYLITSH